MFCSKCGTKLVDGAALCPNCGFPVSETKSMLVNSTAAGAGNDTMPQASAVQPSVQAPVPPTPMMPAAQPQGVPSKTSQQPNQPQQQAIPGTSFQQPQAPSQNQAVPGGTWQQQQPQNAWGAPTKQSQRRTLSTKIIAIVAVASILAVLSIVIGFGAIFSRQSDSYTSHREETTTTADEDSSKSSDSPSSDAKKG